MGKQLLVTLVENGSAFRARYVLVSGRAVLSEGECAPGDLPNVAEARAVIFSRNGYFDRAEVEVRNPRTLPFQARRIIEGALAFNEPFKVRFASHETVAGRHRLDLVAAPDSDIRAALEMLPMMSVPFVRLALAETAIAALVNAETSEPAGVLWMRGGVLVGLLVEKGVVLARSADRPVVPGGGELEPRLERVRASVDSSARRLFPDREIPLLLVFGELVGTGERGTGADTPSRAIETRLSRRFSGVDENAVLAWPELYGLLTTPACFSLLEPGYQEEALLSRYAKWTGVGLLACGVLLAVGGYFQYHQWQLARESFASRNTKLEAEYSAIKQQLPSAEKLAALEQRMNVQAGLTDFRVDSFLGWVSRITPDGALIRHLGVTKGASAPGAAQQAAGTLVMTIEWEVAGDYGSVEQLTAGLLNSLGERAKLSDSKLEYRPGSNAKFTTVLAPLAGAFRE